MCHELSSRPPLPPIAGGAGPADVAGTEELELESGDGTRFAAFAALTAAPGAPGIVILPDVRGLHPYYRDLARRFAEAGVHATVVDYFGRTVGTTPRGEDFDHMPHVKQTTPDQVAADVAAGVAHVRSASGGAADRVFAVGFCFGGRKSFNQAGRGHGLAGVIGFYGPPQVRGDDDPDAPVTLAWSYDCPVLGLFGGADQGIPAEAVDGFDRALGDAGIEHELVTYAGAPHSFFDRSFAEHRDACDDAWRRVLRFVGA